MKILQYLEAGRPELLDAPIPEPGPGQVLMKVTAVTTCPHWDLHYMAGEPMIPGTALQYPIAPGQPGHEATGVVAAVGEGVSEFIEGDHLALWRDQGPGRHGAYAEYVLADVRNSLKVPSSLAPEAIASLELAMCIQSSFNQVLRIFAIEGTRFAISGLGPAGLLGIQIARAYGAAEVVAFDPVPARRELALKLGADRALDPLDPGAFPQDRFSKEAIDLAIDCTGVAAAVQYLMERTRDMVALFGVLRDPVEFGFKHWCNSLHLVGYGPQTYDAAQKALAHVVAGQLDMTAIVSKTLPLEQYREGVELLRKKEAIKICYKP